MTAHALHNVEHYALNVRFGSLAAATASILGVRFTPESYRG